MAASNSAAIGGSIISWAGYQLFSKRSLTNAEKTFLRDIGFTLPTTT